VGFNEMDDMFGRMDRMMNSMVNNMFGGDPFGSAFNMISPFNPSMNPMSRLMSSNALFSPPSMAMNPMIPSSSYYCSSSVMSMSTDMSGRPQIYESSHSTLSAPGGVKETRSSMRDSRTGMQKMAIGHHIEDRAHVMERSRNHYTGEEEHNNEYINIEEEEAPQFNNEFRQKIHTYNGYNGHKRRQLTASGHRHESRPPMLSLPAPPPPISDHHLEAIPHSHRNQRNHKMSHKKKHSDKKTKKPYKKVN